MLFPRSLSHAGHQVVGVAKDEASALRHAAAEHPDLVLMDIRLAGASDGIETAQKMQAESTVRMVFMTAHPDHPKTRPGLRSSGRRIHRQTILL